jgi:hypothetical protein
MRAEGPHTCQAMWSRGTQSPASPTAAHARQAAMQRRTAEQRDEIATPDARGHLIPPAGRGDAA